MREWHDIGHGLNNATPGKTDPGAVSGGMQEHREVERFVDALVPLRKAAGVQVLVTEDLPVTKRDDKAAAWGAEDGYSWHINAGGGNRVEILVNKNATAAWKTHLTALGIEIAKALEIPWGGLKVRDELAVLRSLKNDCIVEFFFIDNKANRSKWLARFPQVVAAVSKVLTVRSGRIPVAPAPNPKPAPGLQVPLWYGKPIRMTLWSRSHRDRRVIIWQNQMRRRGWKITVDGKFGPESKRILLAFQSEKRVEGWRDKHGKRMAVDGILGPQAWEAAFRADVT